MITLRRLPLLLALLTLTQCSKCKDGPAPKPVDQLGLLPRETQTGAGTFGCLVNGQAYTANNAFRTSGDWMTRERLGVSADLYTDGRAAGISILFHGNLRTTGIYRLIEEQRPHTIFSATENQSVVRMRHLTCDYSGEYVKSGRVELTYFDGARRVAAGRFAFVLYEPGGCDSLRVTNGRFDIKF